jgi:hypothetical protein
MGRAEPGFRVTVYVAGERVVVAMDAAVAREQVKRASGRRGAPIWRPLSDADLDDREVLHEALARLAAYILMRPTTDEDEPRAWVDSTGHWWMARWSAVTAIEVEDDSGSKAAVGFRLPESND